MHVVTFYSFKGGVGRTLALANVGVELAQTGRRVLLVDFDLEAPGLHTFEALQPKQPQAGILEFVDDYVTSNAAPDARDYVYEAAGIGQKGGRLWVMPAGRCDRAYQGKLARLNWKDLYAKRDGFLLFEDLKAQWEAALEPDYVLIDSRTGHTDVQGICTRQLPHAVVVLFFPNKQNLDGLEDVVADIRAEEKPTGKQKTKLYFVMSNVPDLDDEEEILKQRLSEFRARLGFDSLTTLIHRYDSLTLLNQAIFTRERPRSRLSREYRKLRDSIVEDNLEDREGAIEFLKRALRPSHRTRVLPEAEDSGKPYRDIASKHLKDGEVLFLLGAVKAREGSNDDALSLYDQALRTSNLPPELLPTALLARGDIRCRKQDSQGAREDILQSLNAARGRTLDVEKAVRLLREVDPSALSLLGDSTAIEDLSFQETISVIRELSRVRAGQEASIKILPRILQDSSNSVKDQQLAKHELSLALIGLGRFEEAMSLLRSFLDDPADVVSTFNYAMAEWGSAGKPDPKLFERILKHTAVTEAEARCANRHQCFAIALWATGATEDASKRLREAEEDIARVKFPEFSCWRYLIASPRDFLADCDEIQRLIGGESLLPLFMRQVSEPQNPPQRPDEQEPGTTPAPRRRNRR